MTGTLQLLHSVTPRLLQHAGVSAAPAVAAGWLVGVTTEGGVLVTSILRSAVNFDKSYQLLQDIGNVSSSRRHFCV